MNDVLTYRKYGPEVLDLSNNNIAEEGMELICKYLSNNITDTKWLNVGYFFKNGWQITPEISDKLCLIFEKYNHQI